MHKDKFKGVFPCFQVLCYAICQEIWVYLFLKWQPSGILGHPATLMTVEIKVQELLHF
jgi:hypothetical protein